VDVIAGTQAAPANGPFPLNIDELIHVVTLLDTPDGYPLEVPCVALFLEDNDIAGVQPFDDLLVYTNCDDLWELFDF
jgi:hypothetical protein